MIKKLFKRFLADRGYTIIKTTATDIDRLIPPDLPDRLFVNSRVCASREDLLPLLPKGGVVVEVGVAYGNFSKLLLDELNPKKFIAIDSFAITADNEPWNQTFLKEGGKTHLEFYRHKFKVEIEQGLVEYRQGFSWDMLAELPAKSVDYLYLDAGHSYEEVAKDLEQVKKVMTDTGIIQFNDYTLFDSFAFIPYGVPKAVNEFLLRENFEVLYLCLHRQFFMDMVVQRIPG